MNIRSNCLKQYLFIVALAALPAFGCSDDDNDKDPDAGDTDSGEPDAGDTETETETETSSAEPKLSAFITVDQFGYRPNAEKIAVIRDPREGFDADESFTPSDVYALVDADSSEQVFTGAPSPWNDGEVDSSSGDAAWWFDFSSVTTPGTYYVLDVEQGARSDVFDIDAGVYREVLKQAVRTFFYQRAGFAKETPYADAGWADAASHIGDLQDTQCRVYDDADNEATERDVSGGWYDAGDYNKYTNWTANYVVAMLKAYKENPSAWDDDYNIPESGNGIPDIIDEAIWGMDHLIRMQSSDGSVLSIVSLDHASPPSAASGQSLYGSASTAAALSASAAFAFGAHVLGSVESWGLTDYADDLITRAENAWSWADANPDVTFYNNDSEYGTENIGAGQQEVDDYGRLSKKIEAAVYLFETTGTESYRTFVDENYSSINMFEWNYVFPYQERQQDMLLYYAALPDATSEVVENIHSTYLAAFKAGDNMPTYEDNSDPYGAYLDSYTWGSNHIKAAQGNIFKSVSTYELSDTLVEDADIAAERYIHYIHGVNPLSLVYLSNMYDFGATNSVNEFYHAWFADGSEDWDRVGTSTYGPPPGYLTGGPNPSYTWDSCCDTNSCGSEANNALCTSMSIEPPLNQPDQKSYLDFNTSWPLNSWAVSENSCGYQVAYIRLLSKFVE